MPAKKVKVKERTKEKIRSAKKEKPAKKEVIVEKPAKRVDIDTEMYKNLFKFLDEKVSVECFIDLHDQCFGKSRCECECHTKK
ncbi:MAG: hypothetical protein QXU32_10380 [Nitrososphaerales archaeon]